MRRRSKSEGEGSRQCVDPPADEEHDNEGQDKKGQHTCSISSLYDEIDALLEKREQNSLAEVINKSFCQALTSEWHLRDKRQVLENMRCLLLNIVLAAGTCAAGRRLSVLFFIARQRSKPSSLVQSRAKANLKLIVTCSQLLQKCTFYHNLRKDEYLVNKVSPTGIRDVLIDLQDEACDSLDIIVYGSVRVEFRGRGGDKEAEQRLLLPGDAYGSLQSDEDQRSVSEVQVFHDQSGSLAPRLCSR